VEKSRFFVFDAHNHLSENFGGGWDQRLLPQWWDILDQAGVVRSQDLDGDWVENLLFAPLDQFKQPTPDHFLVFGGVDWLQWVKNHMPHLNGQRECCGFKRIVVPTS
jgi:hypothetical protein